jgi:hypothetical protein
VDVAPDLPVAWQHGLVDEVRQRLAAFLVASGGAVPGVRVGVALHGWVIGLSVAELRRGLVAAAEVQRHGTDL